MRRFKSIFELLSETFSAFVSFTKILLVYSFVGAVLGTVYMSIVTILLGCLYVSLHTNYPPLYRAICALVLGIAVGWALSSDTD
jgi:hypothetical protein